MDTRTIVKMKVIMAALIAFSFFSCEKKDDPELNKSIDGEILFREILFAEGEALTKIPELQKIREISGIDGLPEDEKKALLQNRKIALDKIRKNHQGFFDNFKLKIQSGDPVQVQQALKEASEKLEATLPQDAGKRISGIDTNSLKINTSAYYPIPYNFIYRFIQVPRTIRFIYPARAFDFVDFEYSFDTAILGKDILEKEILLQEQLIRDISINYKTQL